MVIALAFVKNFYISSIRKVSNYENVFFSFKLTKKIWNVLSTSY